MTKAIINSNASRLGLVNALRVICCLYFAITAHAQEDTTIFCSTYDCVDIAVESARCTDTDDVPCVCETKTYESYLSSCLITEKTHGCVSSDWTSASESLESDCSSYSSSIGADLCSVCFSSAIKSASCLEYDDYDCLCGSKSDDVLSMFTSCATVPITASATCLTSDLAFSSEELASSCSSFSENPDEPEICFCQAAVAEDINCAFQDLGCLCAQDDYLNRLLPCIESSCFSEDRTLVRNSHTSACSELATGGTPAIATTDSASQQTDGDLTNAKGSPKEDGEENDDSDGPETSTVIGVVAGAVAGLSILLVGGYFIFRKRSRKSKVKPPKLPPRPDNLNGAKLNEQQGIYEMWGTQQFPQPTQPAAAHKSATQLHQSSELDSHIFHQPTQPAAAHKSATQLHQSSELDSHIFHQPKVQKWHDHSMIHPIPHQSYVELGPSK